MASPALVAFEENLRLDGGWGLTACYGGRILGVVTMVPDPQGGFEIQTLQACPESALAKDDPQRVSGVGTALLAAAVAKGLTDGLDGDIHAYIKPASEGFYQRMAGFRTPEQPGWNLVRLTR
jgi:GNAT superfamily N-acetyltransferase